jgi:hypothetical protein
MKTDIGRFLPLSPATLHILIALADEDRHGYGIMQEIARQPRAPTAHAICAAGGHVSSIATEENRRRRELENHLDSLRRWSEYMGPTDNRHADLARRRHRLCTTGRISPPGWANLGFRQSDCICNSDCAFLCIREAARRTRGSRSQRRNRPCRKGCVSQPQAGVTPVSSTPGERICVCG